MQPKPRLPCVKGGGPALAGSEGLWAALKLLALEVNPPFPKKSPDFPFRKSGDFGV